ncbi:hypothetical protein SEA_DUMPTRUCK_61 [Gordonia phage DumpTruck]|nr:hypothetical protein SEA_DUMPTRUCK_61 [Gordonia phage DumpTruck]
MLEWWEALAFFAVGAGGGWCLGYAMKMDKLKEQMVREYHEQQEHRKKLQLERNGRMVPRRSDAAKGASRIHKAKINQPPKRGGRR